MAQQVSTAIIPKARAIFARHLTSEEYANLMRRHSVAEIAQYLKNHPGYRDALRSLSDAGRHRSQIEELLRKDIYYKYLSLFRYDFSTKKFAQYFIIENEIEEILSALRFLLSHQQGEYLVRLPLFLANKVCFSLLALGKAKTVADLLRVLIKTPYYKLLAPLLSMEQLDLFLCENILKSYYYEQVMLLINQHFSKSEATQVRELFLREAEIYNLNILFRVKTYFPQAFTAQQLASYLLPIRFSVSSSMLLQMAAAPTAQALAALYSSTRAANQYGPITEDLGAAGNTLYHAARHIIRFSSSPSAVFAALLVSEKTERQNIINVIEGVRYHLSPTQISYLLRV